MIERCRRSLCLVVLLLAQTLSAQEQKPPADRLPDPGEPGRSSLPDSERVRHFAARLQLQPDGSLEVREQITVWALGQQIRHGIYRDVPTQRMDWWSGMHEARIEVLGSTLGGQPVRHRLESASANQRIYLGDGERELPPGQYEFELRYRISDQLQLAGGGSAVHWDVTGSNWQFPVDSVLVEFRQAPGMAGPLPEARGEDGDGAALPIEVEQSDGWLRVHHRQPLAPGSGLVLSLHWPTPLQAQAGSLWQRLSAGHHYGLLGLALLLVWLTLAWLKVGRDPSPGAVQPLTRLPDGQTPGMLRLLAQMAHDPRCFVADLLQLAIAGRLRLVEREGVLVAERTGSADDLALPLRRLHQGLFSVSEQLSLTPSNRARLRSAVDTHRKALLLGSEGQYFRRNFGYWLPGVLIAALTLIVMIVQLDGTQARAIGLFMLVWLSGWTVGVYILLRQVVLQWRSAERWQHRLGALGMTAFSLPFLIGELVGLGVLASVAGVVGALIVLGSLLLLLFFHHWMKAPTAAGRKILDQADGLRLAIEGGHATAAGLELAESLLPVAVALDCAPKYAEALQARFGQALGQGARDWFLPAAAGVGLGVASWSVLASELGGTLQSAIQRATVPSGSSSSRSRSSGSSGGGSRSGGRGGGGGW